LPEGYQIIPKDWLRTNRLPPLSVVANDCDTIWVGSIHCGKIVPADLNNDPFLFYATRAPLPAEPTIEEPYEVTTPPPQSKTLYCHECGSEHHRFYAVQDVVLCDKCVNPPPAEPTASESSGEVHLRQAREESERLSRKLTFLQDKFDQQRAASAAAHTKALAQEGEALAVLESIPKEFAVRIREGGADENIYASLAVSVAKMSKALATPSPAPVAGRPVFTPEECADIKESVLAGMTPGSALVIPRGWNVIIEKLEAMAKLPAPVTSAGPTPPWLPIESAPKDGTIILAEVPDHGAPVVVFWDEALAMAHDPFWVVCWDGEHLSSESRRPIRWQHISTPPVAGEGGEGK
jgi:hypothetical protein